MSHWLAWRGDSGKGGGSLTSRGASGLTPLRDIARVSHGGGCEASPGEETCSHLHVFGLLSAASGWRSPGARGAGADGDRPRASAGSKCGWCPRARAAGVCAAEALSPVLGNSAAWLRLSRF